MNPNTQALNTERKAASQEATANLSFETLRQAHFEGGLYPAPPLMLALGVEPPSEPPAFAAQPGRLNALTR